MLFWSAWAKYTVYPDLYEVFCLTDSAILSTVQHFRRTKHTHTALVILRRGRIIFATNGSSQQMFLKCMNNRMKCWMLMLTVYLTWNYVHLWTWASWLWCPSHGSGCNHKQGNTVILACPHKEPCKFQLSIHCSVLMRMSGKLHARTSLFDDCCLLWYDAVQHGRTSLTFRKNLLLLHLLL
jgi:hypothetical protein